MSFDCSNDLFLSFGVEKTELPSIRLGFEMHGHGKLGAILSRVVYGQNVHYPFGMGAMACVKSARGLSHLSDSITAMQICFNEITLGLDLSSAMLYQAFAVAAICFIHRMRRRDFALMDLYEFDDEVKEDREIMRFRYPLSSYPPLIHPYYGCVSDPYLANVIVNWERTGQLVQREVKVLLDADPAHEFGTSKCRTPIDVQFFLGTEAGRGAAKRISEKLQGYQFDSDLMGIGSLLITDPFLRLVGSSQNDKVRNLSRIKKSFSLSVVSRHARGLNWNLKARKGSALGQVLINYARMTIDNAFQVGELKVKVRADDSPMLVDKFKCTRDAIQLATRQAYESIDEMTVAGMIKNILALERVMSVSRFLNMSEDSFGRTERVEYSYRVVNLTRPLDLDLPEELCKCILAEIAENDVQESSMPLINQEDARGRETLSVLGLEFVDRMISIYRMMDEDKRKSIVEFLRSVTKAARTEENGNRSVSQAKVTEAVTSIDTFSILKDMSMTRSTPDYGVGVFNERLENKSEDLVEIAILKMKFYHNRMLTTSSNSVRSAAYADFAVLFNELRSKGVHSKIAREIHNNVENLKEFFEDFANSKVKSGRFILNNVRCFRAAEEGEKTYVSFRSRNKFKELELSELQPYCVIEFMMDTGNNQTYVPYKALIIGKRSEKRGRWENIMIIDSERIGNTSDHMRSFFSNVCACFDVIESTSEYIDETVNGLLSSRTQLQFTMRSVRFAKDSKSIVHTKRYNNIFYSKDIFGVSLNNMTYITERQFLPAVGKVQYLNHRRQVVMKFGKHFSLYSIDRDAMSRVMQMENKGDYDANDITTDLAQFGDPLGSAFDFSTNVSEIYLPFNVLNRNFDSRSLQVCRELAMSVRERDTKVGLPGRGNYEETTGSLAASRILCEFPFSTQNLVAVLRRNVNSPYALYIVHLLLFKICHLELFLEDSELYNRLDIQPSPFTKSLIDMYAFLVFILDKVGFGEGTAKSVFDSEDLALPWGQCCSMVAAINTSFARRNLTDLTCIEAYNFLNGLRDIII